ncbi:MAG: hypothetical protein C4547_13475 [Phycisphaerales bacterium]|nr:MAG: hypothetical protein C4547_13475 [Phycisphaerales bacterium]
MRCAAARSCDGLHPMTAAERKFEHAVNAKPGDFDDADCPEEIDMCPTGRAGGVGPQRGFGLCDRQNGE